MHATRADAHALPLRRCAAGFVHGILQSKQRSARAARPRNTHAKPLLLLLLLLLLIVAVVVEVVMRHTFQLLPHAASKILQEKSISVQAAKRVKMLLLLTLSAGRSLLLLLPHLHPSMPLPSRSETN